MKLDYCENILRKLVKLWRGDFTMQVTTKRCRGEKTTKRCSGEKTKKSCRETSQIYWESSGDFDKSGDISLAILDNIITKQLHC
jgi:hypothetical protein